MKEYKQPRNERVMQLLSLLSDAAINGKWITKREIFDRVSGYRDSDAKKTSIEQKFERDKNILRAEGVRIRTRDTFDPENAAYCVEHIDPQAAIQADPLESAVMEVALAVLSRSDEELADNSMRKRLLSSLTQPDNTVFPELPWLELPNVHLWTRIATAINSRRSISFQYRSRSQTVATGRIIDPYMLLIKYGSYYVVGFDHSQTANRTFKLSRMVGTPKLTGPEGAYLIPENPESLFQVPTVSPLVQVRSGAAVTLKSIALSSETGDCGSVQMRLPELTLEEWSRRLLALAPDVRIIEPQSLRDLVIFRLKELANV
ncbi:MAG: WYL domain-containing protein [Varibaculum sp.]|nr:WYL domain-containing protein [Varibaculum sp.]